MRAAGTCLVLNAWVADKFWNYSMPLQCHLSFTTTTQHFVHWSKARKLVK